MKILYVGSMTIPLKDILTGKSENEISGWPAYFYPIYKLIKNGHRVEFVVTSDLKDFNISVDWFEKTQIVGNVVFDNKRKFLLRKISRFLYRRYNSFLFRKLVKKAIKSNHYDFVYCQETNGFWGNIYANKYNVPCGCRIYGDTFYFKGKVFSKYEYIKKHGVFSLFLFKHKIYKLYKIKKSFMLTTADGTHGDLTYQLLKSKKKNYDFYYWRTGVDKKQPFLEQELLNKLNKIEYIVYPSRIDSIKRQDFAIDVLSKIRGKGYDIHLFLVGQISDSNYYSSILNKIKEKKLENYVHFTGGVTQNQVKIYAQHSIATLFVSDLSNRGNTFFELFSIGAPIISIDDGSLNDYLIDGVNGFLAKDSMEFAEKVVALYHNQPLRERFFYNAIAKSNTDILSADDRFDLEIKLIEKYSINSSHVELPSEI